MHQGTALEDGRGGGEVRGGTLEFRVAVTDFLAVLLGALFLFTLRQSTGVILEEEFPVGEDEVTAALRVDSDLLSIAGM